MSVKLPDRTESQYEPIVSATNLYELLVDLAQRNFGIRNLNAVARRRYASGIANTENVEHYIWQLQNLKDEIFSVAVRLINHVRAAYATYPTTMHEYEVRRDSLNAAITNCEQIVCLLQEVVMTFDVDINLYKPHIQAIDREIGLIRKWRQKDSKIKSYLQG